MDTFTASAWRFNGGTLMAFTTKSGRTETSLSEINVTPFVDVVLVLLIIFMVTAPVLQSGIEVSVPKTKVVKEVSEERLVISITKTQEVYLNNDHVRLDEIGDALRKHFRDPRGQAVYVRADENVAFGAFATVMSAVKSAGITNVSIVTEPIQPAKK
jgi:biopolymer transport protein ExbD/biopolymer transport protein TolR